MAHIVTTALERQFAALQYVAIRLFIIPSILFQYSKVIKNSIRRIAKGIFYYNELLTHYFYNIGKFGVKRKS